MGHYADEDCAALAEERDTAWDDFKTLHDENQEDRRSLIEAEGEVADIEAEILRLRTEAELAREHHAEATEDREWLVEDREDLVERRDEIAPIVAAQEELVAAIELAEAALEEWQAALEDAQTCTEGLDGADELMPDRYGEMVGACTEKWEEETALYLEWDRLDDDVTAKSEEMPPGDYGDPEDLAAELVTLQENITEDDGLIALLDAELLMLSDLMTQNEADALALETDDLLTATDTVTVIKLLTADRFADEKEAQKLADDLKAEWETNCADKDEPEEGDPDASGDGDDFGGDGDDFGDDGDDFGGDGDDPGLDEP